ncbi:molybdenum cofactor biosynthesis protein A [Azoarcus sp. Aa7]|nr:molybdenum cofactor biosynthesis protein A [Azoarcus sp. Aa7]
MNATNPIGELVINWHLTEACNYRCQYCYATWTEDACTREVIHDRGATEELLQELYRFFRPNNSANQLGGHLGWSSVRLNLAGGEPLLHANRLPSLITQARQLGFDVSLISNGSRLNCELLDEIAPALTWLGISIDSASPASNRVIGRVDRLGRLLDLDELLANLLRARRRHPKLRIKLNTVVNQLNHGEDFGALIQHLAPDKWKVLRMLPVVNQNLVVSDLQFAAFVARHANFSEILCAEDNEDMRESYLMVDPKGRFFQNSCRIPGTGYAYSAPILKVGAEAAFSSMSFEHERFSVRYLPRAVGKRT